MPRHPLQSARDSADKLKRQLAILIGRDAETVQIGEIPAVTSRELEQMNLESDKAKAVIADPGSQINQEEHSDRRHCPKAEKTAKLYEGGRSGRSGKWMNCTGL